MNQNDLDEKINDNQTKIDDENDIDNLALEEQQRKTKEIEEKRLKAEEERKKLEKERIEAEKRAAEIANMAKDEKDRMVSSIKITNCIKINLH